MKPRRVWTTRLSVGRAAHLGTKEQGLTEAEAACRLAAMDRTSFARLRQGPLGGTCLTQLRVAGFLPSKPGAMNIYGVTVLAPCAGEVVVAIDGLPDMRVPETDRAHLAGNHLILHCGDVDVLLGHLQRGSLKVATGMQVGAGQPLAQAGNSGNTGEPHLHIHAQQPGTRMNRSGKPLPVRLDGRFLVRNNRVTVP